MPSLATPLTARSQTLISAVLALLLLSGIYPVLDVIAAVWPIHFGELQWRYQAYSLWLAAIPQLVILFSIVAVLALLAGERIAVRVVSLLLVILVASCVIAVPLFGLDFLQFRRTVPQSLKSRIGAAAIKAIFFDILLGIFALWVGLRGWQASVAPDKSARRDAGAGLVVGQAD